MGVQGISEIITVEGQINVDFGDVKTVMEGKGLVLMGIGRGTGDTRAVDAASMAIKNPLLEDVTIDGAQGILVSVIASPDFSINELNEIMGIITENCHPDAIIKCGYSINATFRDEICVTVIAAGFPQVEEEPKLAARSDDTAVRGFNGPRTTKSAVTEASDLFNGGYRAEAATRPTRLPLRTSGWSNEGNLDIPTILRQGFGSSQGN
jgi:cell division protein FtsZ